MHANVINRLRFDVACCRDGDYGNAESRPLNGFLGRCIIVEFNVAVNLRSAMMRTPSVPVLETGRQRDSSAFRKRNMIKKSGGKLTRFIRNSKVKSEKFRSAKARLLIVI